MVIWAVYATPGSPLATGKNPFGRDCLGYQWATSKKTAIEGFAAKTGLDPQYMEV